MEVKEFLNWLGMELTDETSLEEAKEQFQSKFFQKDNIPEDVTKAVQGKYNGIIENNIKKAFPDYYEEGLSNVDLIKKVSEGTKSKFSELEETVKAGGEKKFLDLKDKYDKLNNDFEQAREANQLLQSNNESLQSEFENYKVEFHKNLATKEAFNSLNYSDTWDNYRRKGFEMTMKEKYDFEVDGDFTYARDKQTNTRIDDPKKIGNSLPASEVLKMELEAVEGAKVNNAPKERVIPTPSEPTGGRRKAPSANVKYVR